MLLSDWIVLDWIIWCLTINRWAKRDYQLFKIDRCGLVGLNYMVCFLLDWIIWCLTNRCAFVGLNSVGLNYTVFNYQSMGQERLSIVLSQELSLDRGGRCILFFLQECFMFYLVSIYSFSYVLKVVSLIVCKKVHFSVMVIVYGREILNRWIIQTVMRLLYWFFNYCICLFILSSMSFNFFPDWF